MPGGTPAGMRCAQQGPDERCLIFGRPDRPAVCRSLQPSAEMCGGGREHAMHWLSWMERRTRPA